MRVLRIITRLNRGGPARTLVAVEPILRDRGVESLLLAGEVEESEDDLTAEARRAGVRVHTVPQMRRSIHPLRDLVARRALADEIYKFQPHVIHTHTFKAGLLARRLALSVSPRFVHTYHGHVFQGYFPGSITHALVKVDRKLALKTHRIVTVAERVKRELVDRYAIAPADKFVVIPGIVPPEEETGSMFRDRETMRAALGVPVRAPWIGTVARLAAVKAPLRFLACAQHVLRQRPDAQFFWIGDGPYRERFLREIERRELSRSVHWFGWQVTTGIWHRRLDVEVLLSENEGLPLSLLEARSHGTPIVCTAVGGVPDLVTDGTDGLLVPEGDDGTQSAVAVLQCLDDPESAKERAVRARRKDEGQYTAERHADRLIEVYESLLTPA